MYLVIVESPTKARTISKFLSNKYKIKSSYGHVRDLPESKLGIDINNNFQPEYIILSKSKPVVKELKNYAKKAEKIILASDEDREGEAIAWHILKILNNKNNQQYQRIVFHEITKQAIQNALLHPRTININLVNAQQARRILDRLVGYKLSPFLWKKVAKGLSAGRVQSVAVRLIVEREREIQSFKAQEYWSIKALFKSSNAKSSSEIFKAKLYKIDNKIIDKLFIKSQKQSDEILNNLKNAKYQIIKIEKKQIQKISPPPFITSTLQQAANYHLGFSAKQTMMIAQQLYEGIKLGKKGSTGLITYMRTDSLNLSNLFLEQAKKYIIQNIGKNYYNGKKIYKTKVQKAQEAHEAIRVTDIKQTPNEVKKYLDKNQFKLYQLIWQKSLASQMTNAILNNTIIDIDAVLENHKTEKYQFRASGQTIKFDGYLRIYPETTKENLLPNLQEKEILNLEKIKKEQHFTKPPARYNDASLVKTLEKYGIGRPSTYAPIISTIEQRNYVKRDENKRLCPQEIAFIVNDLLVKHFSKIVDYKFTAKMEEDLDDIASGNKKWQPVISEFYKPFNENLQKKYKEINKKEVVPEEKTDQICEKCGAPMVVKIGRYGKFLACSNYPKCKNTKNLNNINNKEQKNNTELEKLKEKYKSEKCEKCGAPMVVKIGRYGPFLACSNYPKCKNTKNINKNTGIKCPQCGKGEIVEKRSRRGIFYACNNYPECRFALWSKPTGEKCPKCGSLLIYGKNGNIKCSNKNCDYIKKS